MTIRSAITRAAHAARRAITASHWERRSLHDFVMDPDHVERSESPEFRAAKERLRKDGHYRCWVSGDTENLQVHHLGCEWMFANVVDFAKLQRVLLVFDPYGYSAAMRDVPITSVDDVRNMLVLSQRYHTGVNHQDGGGGTGIHALTLSSWIIQACCMDGANPVPQKGETFAQCRARIEQHERPACPGS